MNFTEEDLDWIRRARNFLNQSGIIFEVEGYFSVKAQSDELVSRLSEIISKVWDDSSFEKE